MKKRAENICRFVTPMAPKLLYVINFVYETNPGVIENMRIKQNNTVYLVVAGKGAFVSESKRKELSAGSLFFTFAPQHFKIENEDGLKYMYITFSGERGEELLQRFAVTPKEWFLTEMKD